VRVTVSVADVQDGIVSLGIGSVPVESPICSSAVGIRSASLLRSFQSLFRMSGSSRFFYHIPVIAGSYVSSALTVLSGSYLA